MRYQGGMCPNCFDQGYGQGECSRCGYKEIYSQRSVRALPSGAVLNRRYIIGKVLGEGGFGITYKALDLDSGSVCAIKEYAPSELSRRREDGFSMELSSARMALLYNRGLDRFLEEAQILRRLGNIPAVVNIFDSFQENHTAYFAMEFLDGADLNKIARASKYQLPIQEITGIILQVAWAMDIIHRKANIFHRDISPENIYITKEQKVKLIDFGSAKELENQLNQEYSIVLKLKFAPPEQHSSRMPQGPYTDVYSLASTYYYVLTGINVPSAVDRLSGESYVPLKQMNRGVPESISDAVDKALELDYRKRTQTMAAFAQQLSTDGSQINGEPHAAGETELSVNVKPACLCPFLEVIAGRMAGVRWRLKPDTEIRLGRSRKESHIAIQGHQEISKIHCTIYYDEVKDCFLIRDVSRNGTFINGKRLERGKTHLVKPGSSLALASPACIVKLETSPVKPGE